MPRLALIIIDGFGVAPPGPGNARSLARMPTIARLEKEVPSCIMKASGNAAGLPEGQQGASEPGHLTIGAGRIVWQPLEEINQAIRTKEFFLNAVLLKACKRAVEKNVPLHLLVIFSYGGVHGHIDHLFAVIDLARKQGVKDILLHLIGDGRDVAERQFCKDLPALQAKIASMPGVKTASLVGRYYAMDRDRQWAARTQLAYRLLALGEGEEVQDVCVGAKAWYEKAPSNERTDYYVKPLKTKDFRAVGPEDVLLDVNFRSDRQVQIIRALNDPEFAEFPRPARVEDVFCMGPYSERLPIAFPPAEVKNSLGEVVSVRGLRQLRIAETDKMAHVTFFFNAQRQEPFPGEDRVLIPSPKVPNFAEAPAMSAEELTTTLAAKVEAETYDFIVANFANPDLVGHGGNIPAVVAALEVVDRCVDRLLPVLERHGYDWIITADHGNSEEMYYPGTMTICPSHTVNPVQTFVHSSIFPTSESLKGIAGLKDIAPLCLSILGIPVPKEMH